MGSSTSGSSRVFCGECFADECCLNRLLMDESFGAPGGFKCCSMCTRHCFEHHGDLGRQETEKLFSAPSFSSLIKASHVMGNKFLRIPVLFMEEQNYNVGDRLRLRGPLGFECECAVQRHSKGFVLHSGFNQFLAHHTIEAGDLLVFNLIAKNYFLIKVYDKSGVEKVFRTGNSSTDAEPVQLSKTLHRLDPKVGSSSKDSRHEEDVEDSGEEGVAEGSDEEAIDRMHNLRRKGKELEEPEATRNQSSGQKRKLSVMPDAFRRGENEYGREQVISSFLADAGEKNEATKRQVNAANAFRDKLKNPSQLVFIKNSHVAHSYTVYLSKLPLPAKSEILTLVDEAGAPYTVNWMVNSDRSRLGSGWEQFVFDHKIAIGDVCIFEANDLHLISVYIFRLTDYFNPTSENQQEEQEHRDDLQPLEQSVSEELNPLGGQAEDTASAGLR